MNTDAAESVDDTADEALLLAYASGDATAFVRFYDRHERLVHRYFLRQSVAASQANDLLQETWMAIVPSAPHYAVDAKFTTWLYTIARRKLIDHWRATRQPLLLDDAANDSAGDDEHVLPLERIAAPDTIRPDVQAMSRQQARAFVTAVEALPAAQREAFLPHVDGSLTIAQMAAVTSVGAETLNSRLRCAMKRMRVACAEWLESSPETSPHAAHGGRDEA